MAGVALLFGHDAYVLAGLLVASLVIGTGCFEILSRANLVHHHSLPMLLLAKHRNVRDTLRFIQSTKIERCYIKGNRRILLHMMISPRHISLFKLLLADLMSNMYLFYCFARLLSLPLARERLSVERLLLGH